MRVTQLTTGKGKVMVTNGKVTRSQDVIYYTATQQFSLAVKQQPRVHSWALFYLAEDVINEPSLLTICQC